MKYQNGAYELSTGRLLFAQMGVIGLGPGSKTIWEGGARMVDQNGLTPVERGEVLEEMLRQWFLWAEFKDPETLAQMCIAFAEHAKRGGTIPTAPNRPEIEKPVIGEPETVVVPRATYEKLLQDAALLVELGGK